jgi:hypothetical protein
MNFKKKNKIACIVGFAPSWIEAPWDRKDVDFFGLNELYMLLAEKKIETPFAAWFEIHDIKNSPSKATKQHQEFLKNCKIPLITQQHWEDYPMSEAYPREEILKMVDENFVIDDKLGGFTDYSNQISWMIAFCIYHGYEEIMVYGVDMAASSEYAWQKQSCYFFLGFAAGRKIKLHIPRTCELLKGCGKLYGFESDNSNRHLVKKKIKSCHEQTHRISVRQSEIEVIHRKIDKDMYKELNCLEKELDLIENEMNISITNKAVATEGIRLLTTMPEDIKTIQAKKPKLIAELQKAIKESDEQLDKHSKAIKTIKSNLDKIRVQNKINHDMLEKEYKNNELVLAELRGQVGNCNHFLGNNIV